ncbi:hypothetical protein BRADI_2g25566v3 [Brachypodium distachyon]|uniref:Uncharacterized protein n=1 Tax=Brachypodium distachyon TaxID=15368 RepID=A0A2K2DAH3_BRADI|nr:hypothetical protein BRADI_2g25566v3 [Brachypodium distachyon]
MAPSSHSSPSPCPHSRGSGAGPYSPPLCATSASCLPSPPPTAAPPSPATYLVADARASSPQTAAALRRPRTPPRCCRCPSPSLASGQPPRRPYWLLASPSASALVPRATARCSWPPPPASLTARPSVAPADTLGHRVRRQQPPPHPHPHPAPPHPSTASPSPPLAGAFGHTASATHGWRPWPHRLRRPRAAPLRKKGMAASHLALGSGKKMGFGEIKNGSLTDWSHLSL